MAGKNRAVIVGVNHYADRSIPPLKGAENDAREIRDILAEDGDFEVKKEHFLTGPAATHHAVCSAISDVLWQTDPCQVTLFYFSGHGFQDSYGWGYVAPYDMERKRPSVRGIQMQGLRELALRAVQKEAVVLVLDCCYAGIAADASAKGEVKALKAPKQCFSDMCEVKRPGGGGKGVFVFSSSSGDQKSRELLCCRHTIGKSDIHEHGAFSFHLIEGLSGVGGVEEQGQVSIATLQTYLDRAMHDNADQNFEMFTSRGSKAADILLVRPKDWVLVSEALKKIEASLDGNDYRDMIVNASQFCELQRNQPHYELVMRLEQKYEDRLEACKDQTKRWLLANKRHLLQRARAESDALHEFVAKLSLPMIENEDNREDSSLGLFLELVKVVQESGSVEDFIMRLPSSGTPPPTVAPRLGKTKRPL